MAAAAGVWQGGGAALQADRPLPQQLPLSGAARTVACHNTPHSTATVIACCHQRCILRGQATARSHDELYRYHNLPSPGPQVAERSLFLWNNEAVVGLVAQHRGAVVPAVLPALEKNARSHWNPAVHGLTVNVRKMFQEMDAQLYEQCRQRFEHEEVCLPCACK